MKEGSYIPITLEQLARERGLLLSDKKTPCQATFHVHHASHGPTANSSSFGILPEDSEQCIIYFLGYEMNTASFALYTFSFSVLVQALLIVSLTGLADHGNLSHIMNGVFRNDRLTSLKADIENHSFSDARGLDPLRPCCSSPSFPKSIC